MRTNMFSDYLVFVDESGDHSLTSIDPAFPLFSLCFCIVRKAEYAEVVGPRIKHLKFRAFGHDCVILHEADIRRKRGDFAKLGKEQREKFLNQLTDVIGRAEMTVVAVVIDKHALRTRYNNPFHPYHIGLQYGLERVRHFLRMEGQHQVTTHVICEARGRKEDGELESAFRRVCVGENRSDAAYAFDIVVCDKKANSEGRQLSDLMARPIALHVLRPLQPNRAFEVLSRKFFTGTSGVVSGNGLRLQRHPLKPAASPAAVTTGPA